MWSNVYMVIYDKWSHGRAQICPHLVPPCPRAGPPPHKVGVHKVGVHKVGAQGDEKWSGAGFSEFVRILVYPGFVSGGLGAGKTTFVDLI